MLALQSHRGPDAEGIHLDGSIVLGHRRLAIIDLSIAGKQPMPNETSDIWITFNGEIYNYRELRAQLASRHSFRSDSDTEAIIHGYEEWGIEGLLRRLRGMFAFGLYDRRENIPKLFLARDRLGIKPLYYSETRESLAFASEVKALSKAGAAGAEVDQDAAISYLCFGSVAAPRTWLKSVRSIPAGHYMEVTEEMRRTVRYWELQYESSGDPVDLSQLLSDTLERHMIADVPLGVFLSGGVDSSGLVALASRIRTDPLFTLTISFAEAEYDEGAVARRFAAEFRTQHHEIHVTDADFMREIPNILAGMDQPTADGVNTYFVSQAARQAGLTVILSGLGGDEVFWGYPHQKSLVSQSGPLAWLTKVPKPLRNGIASCAQMYGQAVGQERFGRFAFLHRNGLHEGLYLLTRGFFPPDAVCGLLDVEAKQVDRVLEEVFERASKPVEQRGLDPNLYHRLECARYLHDQLLRDSDVFSMVHSLELRVPYLDHELVEAVCRLRPEEKISATVNKPKLLEAIGHPAVDWAARRRKRGFTFPFANWMKQHAGELEERASSGQMFSHSAVKQCWAQFAKGRLHWSRAWATVAANRSFA